MVPTYLGTKPPRVKEFQLIGHMKQVHQLRFAFVCCSVEQSFKYNR